MQYTFLKPTKEHHYKHGGTLRQQRAGRFRRPLSCRAPHHIVFKVNQITLRHRSLRSIRGFALSQSLIKKYAKKFFVKIEQVTIQHDHIHMMIRTSQRSLFHNFFRVMAGQIAQQFEKEGLLRRVTNTGHQVVKNGKIVFSVTDTLKRLKNKKLSLWKYRPFSYVVKSRRAYKNVRNYIQLNEKEVTGFIPYRKKRLKGLTNREWELLWS